MKPLKPPVFSRTDLAAWAMAMAIAVVILAIVTACASAPAQVVVSDRPLSPRELRQIETEVKAALPPACEATSLDVRGTTARFDYTCFKPD